MSWHFPTYKVDFPTDWETLESNFPWLRDMHDVPQDPVWHGEGDVFVHTQMVVEALINLPQYRDLEVEEKHILFAAALLHDVEKRSTTTTEIIAGKERIVSPKHARKGELTTRSELYMNLTVPFSIREQIAKLVRYHGLPLWAIEKPDPRKAVIHASLEVNTRLLALLTRADVLGRICADKEELLLKVDLFEELCKEHNCWGKAYAFKSAYGRYEFLNRREIAPDYEPYEDHQFEVLVMCALPGAGKDTYINRNLDLPILSLDDLRREHGVNPTDKKKNGQIIQMGKEKAKEMLRAKQSFVYNATNITQDMRSRWISLFTTYKARVKIIYIEVPYQNLLVQNENRDYAVPTPALHKLIQKLEIPAYHEAHELEFIVES